MKNLILFLLLIVSISSCREEGIYTSEMNSDFSLSSSLKIKEGTFQPTVGIVVMGNVEIYIKEGKSYLKLSNFSVSKGPDLKVYLSKANTPTEFVNLGPLQNDKIYELPIPIGGYSYVLIHCQQYNHLFATAKLN